MEIIEIVLKVASFLIGVFGLIWFLKKYQEKKRLKLYEIAEKLTPLQSEYLEVSSQLLEAIDKTLNNTNITEWLMDFLLSYKETLELKYDAIKLFHDTTKESGVDIMTLAAIEGNAKGIMTEYKMLVNGLGEMKKLLQTLQGQDNDTIADRLKRI